MTAYVVLHEEGRTIGEVVEFVEATTPGAVEVTEETARKYRVAIEVEVELRETLRTGLHRRARGTGRR